MNIVVLERNSVGTDIDVSCFEKYGNVTYYANTLADQVADRVAEAEIIVANKGPLNENTLKGAPNVKLICMMSTGYDVVDIGYCAGRGIKVTNVVDYCTASVAQHTLMLALMLSEKAAYYDEYVKSGAYGAQDRFSHFGRRFHELGHMTWGIVGMGNIGRRVAALADAFGCRVIFYSASGNSTCTKYPRVDFDTLLRESDILSLHCPLSDRTRHLMDKDAFDRMKKTAILINVARGPVVNTRDLYDALVEGKIMAAGLDVLEREPIEATNPLNQIKDGTKLVITPHMSWGSVEARTLLVSEVAKNIEAFLNGTDRNVIYV